MIRNLIIISHRDIPEPCDTLDKQNFSTEVQEAWDTADFIVYVYDDSWYCLLKTPTEQPLWDYRWAVHFRGLAELTRYLEYQTNPNAIKEESYY